MVLVWMLIVLVLGESDSSTRVLQLLVEVVEPLTVSCLYGLHGGLTRRGRAIVWGFVLGLIGRDQAQFRVTCVAGAPNHGARGLWFSLCDPSPVLDPLLPSRRLGPTVRLATLLQHGMATSWALFRVSSPLSSLRVCR